MQVFASRAGRRSLAHTIVILGAAAALGACADETTAPVTHAESPSAAVSAEKSPGLYTTSVDIGASRVALDPVNGAVVDVGVSCSNETVFDVIVDVKQNQRVDGAKTVVEGSATFPGVTCNGGVGFYLLVPPTAGNFQLGAATVRARIANYQPGVEPADVTRRVRITGAIE